MSEASVAAEASSSITAASSSSSYKEPFNTTRSNTMEREYNMPSKLDYIYFNNTLILQCSNAPLFCGTDATPAPSAASYLPVTSPLQPLQPLLPRMYGLSNTSHTCHTRQLHQLHLLYKYQTPANTHTHSQLTAMAATAAAASMSPLQAAEQLLG